MELHLANISETRGVSGLASVIWLKSLHDLIKSQNTQLNSGAFYLAANNAKDVFSLKSSWF